jgi:malonate transporter and related proteins
MLQAIVQVLFPLMALIVLGYGLKQSNWLELSFWQGAEKLNYYLLFPIMLFLNLATAEIQINIIYDVLLVVGFITMVCSVVLYGLKAAYTIPIRRFGVYTQSLLRFNTYIGIALISSLFHQAGMIIFAVIMVFFIPLVNIISVVSLTDTQHLNLKQIILNVVKNPLIVGCVVGGLFNLSGFILWDAVNALFKLVAACSLPLGLMCVGAALHFQGMSKDSWQLGWATFARLCLMPLLAYVVCWYFNLDLLMTQVLVVFFALPTASASYILTKVYGGDSELMAKVISFQMLCAAITIPIILSLLMA